MKDRIKQLGDAINETLSSSDRIAEAIAAIKSEGYDVFLVLEATVGFNKQENEEKGEAEEIDGNTAIPELEVNAQDVRFLKSLKISVDEEAEAA
jgi:uncharacterized protein (UPF0335 family)